MRARAGRGRALACMGHSIEHAGGGGRCACIRAASPSATVCACGRTAHQLCSEQLHAPRAQAWCRKPVTASAAAAAPASGPDAISWPPTLPRGRGDGADVLLPSCAVAVTPQRSRSWLAAAPAHKAPKPPHWCQIDSSSVQYSRSQPTERAQQPAQRPHAHCQLTAAQCAIGSPDRSHCRQHITWQACWQHRRRVRGCWRRRRCACCWLRGWRSQRMDYRSTQGCLVRHQCRHPL